MSEQKNEKDMLTNCDLNFSSFQREYEQIWQDEKLGGTTGISDDEYEAFTGQISQKPALNTSKTGLNATLHLKNVNVADLTADSINELTATKPQGEIKYSLGGVSSISFKGERIRINSDWDVSDSKSEIDGLLLQCRGISSEKLDPYSGGSYSSLTIPTTYKTLEYKPVELLNTLEGSRSLESLRKLLIFISEISLDSSELDKLTPNKHNLLYADCVKDLKKSIDAVVDKIVSFEEVLKNK